MYTNEYEKQAYKYVLSVPTPIDREEMLYDVVMHLYDVHLNKVPLNESGLLCIIKHDPEFVFLLRFPSELAMIRALKSNPKLIRFMIGYGQTENMQLVVVKACGEMIRYCREPSVEVQRAAIIQNHYALQYIESPPQEIIELARSIAPNVIKLIKEK